MACALTQDFNLDCRDSVGGLKVLYLIELGNITSYTESSGTLTAITKATGKIFRKYQLELDTSTFEEDLTGNRQNGTLYVTQTGTVILNKQQVSVRNELLLLGKNRLVAVGIDNNGFARLYGRTQGLMLTTGKATLGTAWGDRNGYTLTLVAQEPELAPYVDSATQATLQTPG